MIEGQILIAHGFSGGQQILRSTLFQHHHRCNVDLGINYPHLCDKDLFLTMRYFYKGKEGKHIPFLFHKKSQDK